VHDLRQVLAVRQKQLAEQGETQIREELATSEPTSRFLRVMPTAALRTTGFFVSVAAAARAIAAFARFRAALGEQHHNALPVLGR
jgi:hypothetical protein